MTNKTPDKTPDEERLNQLLDGLPSPAPASDDFLDRLMAIPAIEQARAAANVPEQNSWLNALRFLGATLRPSRLLPQAVGLAAAGSLGIMLGLSSVARPADPIEVFDTSAYLLGDPGLVRDLEDID